MSDDDIGHRLLENLPDDLENRPNTPENLIDSVPLEEMLARMQRRLSEAEDK
jgi:hypothetical protein